MESNTIRLSIDPQTNKYSLWDHKGDGLTEIPDISTGIIIVERKIIKCIDKIKKHTIIFSKLDDYRLIVINKNQYFKINDILYAIIISDKNGKPYQWMKWKNGKKHGEWSIDCEKGVNYTIYENGVIKKRYFKTYKVIREELLKAPVML